MSTRAPTLHFAAEEVGELFRIGRRHARGHAAAQQSAVDAERARPAALDLELAPAERLHGARRLGGARGRRLPPRSLSGAAAMRIAYVSTSRIPSRAANGLQAMRRCAAFAGLGHAVTHFSRPGEEDADPFAFYGAARDLLRARGYPALRRQHAGVPLDATGTPTVDVRPVYARHDRLPGARRDTDAASAPARVPSGGAVHGGPHPEIGRR